MAKGPSVTRVRVSSDRRVRQLLGDPDFVFRLDQKAIVLVLLLIEDHLLERIDLAGLRIEDAENLACGAGSDVLEHSVAMDEFRKLHGTVLQLGVTQGSTSVLRKRTGT